MLSLLFQVGDGYAKTWGRRRQDIEWSDNSNVIEVDLPDVNIDYEGTNYHTTGPIVSLLSPNHFLLLNNKADVLIKKITPYFHFLDKNNISHETIELVNYTWEQYSLGLDLRRDFPLAEDQTYKLSTTKLREALKPLVQDLNKVVTKYVPTGEVMFKDGQFRFVGTHDPLPQIRTGNPSLLVSTFLSQFFSKMKALGKFDATELKF
jgi:hypothetical protein